MKMPYAYSPIFSNNTLPTSFPNNTKISINPAISTQYQPPHCCSTRSCLHCVLWFYDGLIVYITSFMQELCPKFKERFIWKFVLDHNRWNEKRRCLSSRSSRSNRAQFSENPFWSAHCPNHPAHPPSSVQKPREAGLSGVMLAIALYRRKCQ